MEIEYPASDGKPLGETDFHVDAILGLKALLRRRYRGRKDVYVAANNFIYFTEGNIKDRFSPDCYVVFGVDSAPRRSYFLFRERRPPGAVFEFSSRKTRKEDATRKKDLCARLGIKEYFLCDPESDYLKPPLQGFRLADGIYQAIPANADGSIHSEQLGAKLRLEHSLLALYDDVAGAKILSADEVAELETSRANLEAIRAREAEEKSREAEEKSRQVEAENARLRDELERLRKQQG